MTKQCDLIDIETDAANIYRFLGRTCEVINLLALAMRLEPPTDKLQGLLPAYPSQTANIEYMLGWTSC